MNKFVGVFTTVLLTLSTTWAAQPFTNLESYKNSLGFTRFYSSPYSGRPLKIAVIDDSFPDFQKEVGKSLPGATQLIARTGSDLPPNSSKNHNGTRVAQLLIAMMTDDLRATQWIPELFLYEVKNTSDIKNAIDHILNHHVDLVLSGQTWNGAGNFDGSGYINEQVNRATRQGVIWINNTGDFAQTTFNSTILPNRDSWVRLPDQNESLMLRCERNPSGKCLINVSLSWNDFKTDLAQGTDKDLDLALTDDMLNILKTSTLKQTTNANETRPEYSLLPAESMTAELNPGIYFLRVKDRSNNFTSRDQLRLVVDGNNILLPSHSKDETLPPLADNLSVITVGANDSITSSSSVRIGKPDLVAPSTIVMAHRLQESGSNYATAIVGAGLGLLKIQNPHWQQQDLLNAVRSSQGDWNQGGLSLNLLGFRPTGPGCFWDVTLNPLPSYLSEIISKGGVPVETTAAIRIIVPFDPVNIAPYLRRQQVNDMIVALPQGGYGVFPRYAPIPNGAAEIFQRPLEAGLCRPRPGGSGKNFRL